MKNELGFIPDNISAISNASLYMQPTTQHDPTDNQDSTDHLVEEILRQRAERLQREEEKAELGSLDETNKKLLLEIKDSKEEMASGGSEFRLKDSLKTSREKLSRHDLIIPEINESIAEKQEMSEVSPDNQSLPESHPQFQPTPSKSVPQLTAPIQQTELLVEDRIEVLNNQTKGESEHEGNLSDRDPHEEAIRSINSKESSVISKPQSLQRSSGKKEEDQNISMDAQEEERIPKLNLSISPSEKKSQRSLLIHHLIEENVNEENSEHGQPSNPAQSHHDKPSNHSHHSQHSQQHSHPSQSHREQMARELEAIQSQIEVKHSMVESETPINIYEDKKGQQEFKANVEQQQPDQQNPAKAITEQINSPRDQPAPQPPRQPARPARESGHSAAAKSQQGDFTADYSECPRQLLILQHRYQSNVQLLFVQTRELLQLYHSMFLDQQKKQTRRALMMLQIENRREKISLRNASYTKRYNFISPIGRNNDKPIQYVPKFKVKQELLYRLEELVEQINHQKHLAAVQEQKLQLLTRYYEHAKGTTIPHGPNPQEHYVFDSVLGKFTCPGQPTPPLPASMMASNTAPRTNRTPLKSQATLKSPTALKSATSLNSPAKTKVSATQKVTEKLQAATPQSYFNLLHYKREIGKQMVAQFEVFTLGKLKRLRDENRLLKKELQFVEQHVENFDRQFAEELKQYQMMSKPKVTYESFQVVENKTPFTKSPHNREYHANNRGSNNINVYRPDSSPPPRALSKSLSQSKYTIQRPPVPNPKLVSPNTSNRQLSQKGKRKTLNSPNRYNEKPKQQRFKDVQLSQIAEAVVKGRPPKRLLNRSNSTSKKSISGMKNWVKNRESVQTEQCLPTPSQLPQVTSEYYISFDRNPPY